MSGIIQGRVDVAADGSGTIRRQGVEERRPRAGRLDIEVPQKHANLEVRRIVWIHAAGTAGLDRYNIVVTPNK